MREPQPTIQRQLNSRNVLFRFTMRFVLLSAFALIGTHDFMPTLAALLMLSAVFCAMAGATRGESIFGPALTHWDEAAAFAVLGWSAFAPWQA